MKRPSRLPQQRSISRILYEGVLEQVGYVRRHALPEQQTGVNETVQGRSKINLLLPRHCGQKSMGKLAPDSRPDLRYFFRRAEPVETRHQ